MKIGIDGIYLEGQRIGIGRYLESLLRQWALCREHQFIIYYINDAPEDDFLSSSSIEIRKISFEEPFGPDIFSAELEKHPIDVFFSPYYDLPDSLRVPGVITVHDMVHEASPESLTKLQLEYFRYRHASSLPRAVSIITDSEFSKRGIVRHFPDCSPKISVIPLAASEKFKKIDVDADFPFDTFGVKRPFIFYVGTVTEKRPVRPLLEAFKLIAADFPEWNLILAGKNATCPSEDIGGLVFDVNKQLSSRRIVYGEFVTEEQLLKLYCSAGIFAYLSSYEGFGLPPLEAFACGVPVLTTSCSSLPEVTADAAMITDPFDVITIAGSLRKFMADEKLRDSFVCKGFVQKDKFSWKKTAALTLSVITEVV